MKNLEEYMVSEQLIAAVLSSAITVSDKHHIINVMDQCDIFWKRKVIDSCKLSYDISLVIWYTSEAEQ